MNNYFSIDERWMSFEEVKDLVLQVKRLSLTETSRNAIIKCRHYLENKLESTDELFYGINTGFGFLQNVQINKVFYVGSKKAIFVWSCAMSEEQMQSSQFVM